VLPLAVPQASLAAPSTSPDFGLQSPRPPGFP
jgi:hypothetical protein